MKLASRIGLVMLLALSSRTAEAARISVNELNEGGGTIINDGSGDVASSNGTTSLGGDFPSNTDLLSALGLTNLNLANDLANLHIVGAVTDSSPQNNDNLPAVSAQLNVLRVTGTLNVGECATCGRLNDVNVGGSLGLDPLPGGNQFNAQNVLFAFDIVGSGGFSNVPWGLSGTAQPPMTVGIGQPLNFQLNASEINLIVSRMAQYSLSVDDVRWGFGAYAAGVTATGGYEGVRTTFETQSVPEPGTLMLLGAGLATLGLRRRRRSPRH